MKELILCLALLTAPLSFTGCAPFRGAPIEAGARGEVVHAERMEKQVFALVDTFLEWEHHNRAIVSPNVTHFANGLRADFPAQFEAFHEARLAYKAFPSGETLNQLQVTKAVIQLVYNQLLLYAPASVEADAAKKVN